MIDAIVRARRDVELRVFADPEFSGVREWADVPRTTLVPVPFQSWSRWKAQLWEQFVFPRCCLKAGIRAAHHPITTCPRWRWGLRNLVTVFGKGWMSKFSGVGSIEWWFTDDSMIYVAPLPQSLDKPVSVTEYKGPDA